MGAMCPGAQQASGSSWRSGSAHFLVQSPRHFGTRGISLAVPAHGLLLFSQGAVVVVCLCVWTCVLTCANACLLMHVCVYVLVSDTAGEYHPEGAGGKMMNDVLPFNCS